MTSNTAKIFLFVFLTTFSLIVSAQIKFEKGYFIDENNIRIECLIRNADWENNPVKIQYKQSEESETITVSTSSIKELEIYGASKYVSAFVKMSKESNELKSLTYKRNLVLIEEQVFLKVLIEGKASLYEYHQDNLTRFFYKVDQSPVHQLIYKRYLSGSDVVQINSDFRQQLSNDVRCDDSFFELAKKLRFNKPELIKYFEKYNLCTAASVKEFKGNDNGIFLNLRVMPGLNYASFHLEYRNGPVTVTAADFENEFNFRIGFQNELILPFRKNKWSVVLEPTYQYFHASEKRNDLIRSSEIKYRSIELPLGLRHYFFLGDRHGIFLNGFFVMDINLNSEFSYTESSPRNLDIDPHPNFAWGAGYQSGKLSMEFRLYNKRRLITNHEYWVSGYGQAALIFGYKIY